MVGPARTSLEGMGIPSSAVSDRFWGKVARGPEDTCWLWTGCRNHLGYGLFKVGRRGVNCRAVGAHRIAFEIGNGRLSEGLGVFHRCDNPPCCNPAHLFAGKNEENMRDRNLKGRQSKGEKQADAKLTDAEVRQIRAQKLDFTVAALARRYRVSHPTMWKVVNDRTWRHVR